MKRTALAVVSALALVAGSAQAAIIVYSFPLDGLQEVPPNASPATGFAMVTLDTATNALDWEVSYAGLLAPLTAAHFHAPAPPGVNAGVVVPIPIGPSPMIGSAVVSDAMETWILDGLSYVNLHTTMFPGGEIRGQVVPEPAALILLALLVPALRRR